MNKIINENGQPNFGIFNELPLDFNYKDYEMLDFFDQKADWLTKQLKFHAFHYIGIITKNNNFPGH